MTQAEIEEFRTWHEKRLEELQYPAAIADKLRADREHWLTWKKKK